eukprot:g4939.t1
MISHHSVSNLQQQSAVVFGSAIYDIMNFESLKYNELRKELKKRNLNAKGKKADLLRRLLDHEKKAGATTTTTKCNGDRAETAEAKGGEDTSQGENPGKETKGERRRSSGGGGGTGKEERCGGGGTKKCRAIQHTDSREGGRERERDTAETVAVYASSRMNDDDADVDVGEKECESNSGVVDDSTAKTVMELIDQSVACVETGDLNEVRKYYNLAMLKARKEKKLDEEVLEIAMKVFKLGNTCSNSGYISNAAMYYEYSLSMQRSVHPDRDMAMTLQIAKTMHALGTMRFQESRFEEARDLNERSLAMHLAVHPKGEDAQNEDIAEMLGNIGTIAGAMGHWVEAVNLTKRALAMFDTIFPDEYFHEDILDFSRSLYIIHVDHAHSSYEELSTFVRERYDRLLLNQSRSKQPESVRAVALAEWKKRVTHVRRNEAKIRQKHSRHELLQACGVEAAQRRVELERRRKEREEALEGEEDVAVAVNGGKAADEEEEGESTSKKKTTRKRKKKKRGSKKRRGGRKLLSLFDIPGLPVWREIILKGYFRKEEEEDFAVMTRSRCKHLLRNFDSPTEPSIGLGKYLDRLTKYLKCTKESYVLALAYLERLTRTVRLEITPLNEHRLLLVGVRVASKFLNDVHFDNKYYAEIGGISVKELNFLELAFVYALAFRLYVSESDYERVRRRLEEGDDRAWRFRGEEGKIEGRDEVARGEAKIRARTPKSRRRRSATDEVEESLRAHLETLVLEEEEEEKKEEEGKDIVETKQKDSGGVQPRTPPTPKYSPDAIAGGGGFATKGNPRQDKKKCSRHTVCEGSALEADRRSAMWGVCK